MSDITWEKETEVKFNKMMEKIPAVMRGIANGKILKKAQSLATQENRSEMNEKDLVDAFFSETPGGFQGPMKCDMEEFGIDYEKYGHVKDGFQSIKWGKKTQG